MQVRELVTRLGFDADLSEAQRYDSAMTNLRRTTAGVAAVFATARASLSAMAHDVGVAGNEIALSAREAGMAADEFQATAFALERVANVSRDQARQALTSLNARLGEAARGGSQTATVFREIGFSSRELAEGQVTAGEAVQRLGEYLRTASTDAEAAAIASDAIGEGIGQRLGPAIRRGEADIGELQERFRELGGGMRGEGLQSAERYSNALTDLRAAVDGLWNRIGSRLIPELARAAEGITDWVASNRELLEQQIATWIVVVQDALENLRRVLRAAFRALGSVVESLGGMRSALHFVVHALGLLVGLRFVRGILRLAMSLRAAAASAGLLGLALGGLPYLVVAALVLLLYDAYLWITENEGALAEWLGSWEDFKAEVQDKVLRPILERLGEIRNVVTGLAQIIRGAVTLDWADVAAGWNRFAGQLQEWAEAVGGALGEALRNNIMDAFVPGVVSRMLERLGVIDEWGGGVGLENLREPAGRAVDALSGTAMSPMLGPAASMGASPATPSVGRSLSISVSPTINVPTNMPQRDQEQVAVSIRTELERMLDREVQRAERDIGGTE